MQSLAESSAANAPSTTDFHFKHKSVLNNKAQPSGRANFVPI